MTTFVLYLIGYMATLPLLVRALLRSDLAPRRDDDWDDIVTVGALAMIVGIMWPMVIFYLLVVHPIVLKAIADNKDE